MRRLFANTIRLLNSLTNYFVMTIDQLREKIAAEKQQFADYKASVESQLQAKDQTIAERDARIAELEAQVANPSIPDDIITSVGEIVP